MSAETESKSESIPTPQKRKYVLKAKKYRKPAKIAPGRIRKFCDNSEACRFYHNVRLGEKIYFPFLWARTYDEQDEYREYVDQIFGLSLAVTSGFIYAWRLTWDDNPTWPRRARRIQVNVNEKLIPQRFVKYINQFYTPESAQATYKDTDIKLIYNTPL